MRDLVWAPTRRAVLAGMAATAVVLALPGRRGLAGLVPAGASAAVDKLLDLVEQRMAVMPDVARHKYNTGGAVEDLPREAQVITAVSARAKEAGIDADLAADFFQAQIDASKIMQTSRITAWKAAGQGKFSDVPDLATSIRPTLDRLTPEMVATLKDALPALRTETATATIEARIARYTAAHPDDAAAFRRAVEPLRVLGKP